MSLVEEVLDGSRLALARVISHIEDDTLEGREALNELFPQTGCAHLIGVTGAPGTGKSTLVNQLAKYFRQPDRVPSRQVGIVAVDPTSPFSGGAILGDRVRMRDLAGDPGVFIRSMATRGSLGGLAVATSGVVQAMDAAGFDMIFIETVGTGQAEVEIANLAHTTIVIEAPGFGDEIQAIKAGILEIADILVVNKADRPGVEATERALRSMLELASPGSRLSSRLFRDQPFHHQISSLNDSQPSDFMEGKDNWITPILRTVATNGTGVSDLAETIHDHYGFIQENGELKQRESTRLRSELDLLLRETLVAKWRSRVSGDRYEQAISQLIKREISPRQAVDFLVSS